MDTIFIFGMGYSATYLAGLLRARGWRVSGTGRGGTVDFADRQAVLAGIAQATHVLSSVPPDGDSGADPVLAHYGAAIVAADLVWTGYLSSTGVYGDTAGAWVDESAPIGGGRRGARAAADAEWQALRPDVRVFRLPGIYGPGRSAIERVRAGRAHRIDLPDQVFSRVHIDDIASGVIASFGGPPGVYNLADDLPCAQNRVIEAACAMLGVVPPPLTRVEEAGLSGPALAFYAENRRVANGRAKRLLDWRPRYPDYRTGLRACMDVAQASGHE